MSPILTKNLQVQFRKQYFENPQNGYKVTNILSPFLTKQSSKRTKRNCLTHLTYFKYQNKFVLGNKQKVSIVNKTWFPTLLVDLFCSSLMNYC